MREADYTDALSEAVTMAFAPLRAFAKVLEAVTNKGVSVHPYDAGVVTSALVDYSERWLADAMAMVEAKVGGISRGFEGHSSSIADKVVDAELIPAKDMPRA